MMNYYLLMNIQNGVLWIHEVLQDSVDDVDYKQRLSGVQTFKIQFWVVAGPLTKDQAYTKRRELNAIPTPVP